MRIGVFSDVHGNCVALNEVIAGLGNQSVDGMVCLGDAIQGGAQPADTLSRLRGLGVPTVMGNADYWLLTGEVTSADEPASDAQKEVRAWSLSKLKEEDLDFVRHFKSTIKLPLGSEGLLCFHGSPASFDEKIWPTTPEEEFRRMVRGYGDSILCGGHTHLQHLRRFKDSFYFNPGSVGLSYDHSKTGDESHFDSWAEHAIISADHGARGVEFRRVPFNAKEWIRITKSSGRPYADRAAREYSTRT